MLSLKIASRSSDLAVLQVDEVISLLGAALKDISVEREVYSTQGDRDRSINLATNKVDDIFTDTVDKVVLSGEMDIAVHSAKDLPKDLPDGLEIMALTSPVDRSDSFVGHSHLKDLAKGSRVGTSSPLRKAEILKVNANVECVDIRGTIAERVKQFDQDDFDGVIVATAALKRLGKEGRITEICPWDTTALQGQLAIVGRVGDKEVKSLFSAIDCRRQYGQAFLVGAGPGDPELITVKGIRILSEADCVFYDYLAHPDLLTYAPKAEKIYAGKRKGEHSIPQSELCRKLRDKIEDGKIVVRLKGGDPLIFGRGAEEIDYLNSYHMAVTVIPGVSSATAIPSSLALPLTARDVSSSVAFVSAHNKNENMPDAESSIHIPNAETLVFLMGLSKLDVIVEELVHQGWSKDTPVMIVSRGTCADENIVVSNLRHIQELVTTNKIQPPALIIVGHVVHFYKDKKQFQRGTLFTGTQPQYYKALGEIIHFPLIEISKKNFLETEIQKLSDELKKSDIVLFTSGNAVQYLFEILEASLFDLQELRAKQLFVIGRHTQFVLKSHGFDHDVISRVETGRGLLEQIAASEQMKGKRIVFPRSSLPNPFLKEELSKMGCDVYEVVVYENTKPQHRPLPDKDIERIVFTSPSTVDNFLEEYETIPLHWQIICRGPVTRKRLKEHGYKSEVLIHG